jgi:dihydrofolate reductase
MRKIIAVLDISLDGVVEAPETWRSGPAAADGVPAFADTALVGRKTYESIVSGVLALDGVRKLVVSSKLTKADAVGNSEVLIGEHPLRTIAALKRVPGRDLAVVGSPMLVRSLLGLGLVDELRLTTHPVVVGRGARLFEDAEPLTMELTSSALRTGVLRAVYQTC